MADPTNVVLRRVGAFIIDGILIGAVNVGLFLLMAHKQSTKAVGSVTTEISINSDHYVLTGGRAAAYWAAVFAVGFLYFAIIQGRTGATIGKALLGIRVVREDGGMPGIWKAFVRNVLWIVDALFFYLVALITALASKKHQRVGDMVAKTYVVRRDSVGQPIEQGTIPPPPPPASA